MPSSRHLSVCAILLLSATLACSLPGASRQVTAPPLTQPPTGSPASPTPAIPLEPSATPLPASLGPSGFPPDVDPLTGQTVPDPAVLNRRPLLIKVSNESQKVRPQSGLSFADHVWEYQMEGYALTRYTAVIYGQTPERVGSVRSARLIDVENLMDMYGGILVYSGASSNRHAKETPPRVNELINAAPWVQRVVTQDYLSRVGAAYSEPYFQRLDYPTAAIPDYHKLFAMPAEIWRLANEKAINERPNLDGLVFNTAPPGGGTATTMVSIDYPGKGPKRTWTYDSANNRWISTIEDQQSGLPDAVETDMITGQPLMFDNVVIVHAFHSDANFLEDEAAQLYSVRIVLNGEGLCTLLRDGQRFDCVWRRADRGGMIQFFDINNNPLVFKPGNTWFNVATSNIPSAKPVIAFAP